MFEIIAAFLVIFWLVGFFVIHAGGALIHFLLIIAVIMIIFRFIQGRSL